MMVTILLSAVVAHASPTEVPARPVRSFDGPVLTVADLSSLSSKDLARYGHFELARAPGGGREVVLTADHQRALVRRRVPGLSFELKADGAIVWHSKAGGARAPRSADRGQCSQAVQPVRIGEALTQNAIMRAPCRNDDTPTGGVEGPIVTRAAKGLIVAARDVAAGDYLGRLRVEALPHVVPGQKLTLIARDGPVTVERDVAALQSATSGQSLFTRADNGDLVVARLAAPQNEEDHQ